MIGLSRGTVDVVPYALDWGPAFQDETLLLRQTLGPDALALEHIGSTAIEGMPAKPIIDLMVAVDDLSTSKQLILLLADVGYDYRPNDCVADRHFFAASNLSPKTARISSDTSSASSWFFRS